MKKHLLVVTLVLALIGLHCLPAQAASKEMIQLQTQVQQLLSQVSLLKQSTDQSLGAMKNLVEQNTDIANKVSAQLTDLQAALQKQQADSGGKVDQLSGQIQALNDTMDELKARLAKVGKQLEDMQATQQNLATQQTQGAAPPAEQVPPADVLYQAALRDYNGGKTDLAMQELSDYVQHYGNTDLAGNAYFYLAEMEYKQGNFQKAVTHYDQVLQNFPSGNKAASAQYKKGMALLQLGNKKAAAVELQHVVQRYPRSNEAAAARSELRKLGQ